MPASICRREQSVNHGTSVLMIERSYGTLLGALMQESRRGWTLSKQS